MASIPGPDRAAFLSTGVVSRALGLEPNAVRTMIELETLPEPQWITFGSRVERIYSLEWLILASERLNSRRLPGLEYGFDPKNMVQFAVRFERSAWTLTEVSRKLIALDELWKLCARTLDPGEELEIPVLNLRRLSAGSPLDLLAWADQNWGGLLGTGGLAAIFIYILRNPDKVVEAIPRALTAWREQWAKADDAAVHRALARLNRKDFEKRAAEALRMLDAVPSETALSGVGTSQLEIMPHQEPAAAKGLPESNAETSPELHRDDFVQYESGQVESD